MADDGRFQTIQCCADGRPIGDASDPWPLIVILLAALWFYSRRNLISGTAKVVSGSIITVGSEKIRLYAMYGLMLGQSWLDRNGVKFDGGERSKAALASKIDGKRVKCWIEPKGGVARGAKICRGYLDGDDVGEWMVRQGYAVADSDPTRRKPYLRAEN